METYDSTQQQATNKGEIIFHALDSDVFVYCSQYTDWQTGDIGTKYALSYACIALALTD